MTPTRPIEIEVKVELQLNDDLIYGWRWQRCTEMSISGRVFFSCAQRHEADVIFHTQTRGGVGWRGAGSDADDAINMQMRRLDAGCLAASSLDDYYLLVVNPMVTSVEINSVELGWLTEMDWLVNQPFPC